MTEPTVAAARSFRELRDALDVIADVADDAWANGALDDDDLDRLEAAVGGYRAARRRLRASVGWAA
jgi:hypothetical protein